METKNEEIMTWVNKKEQMQKQLHDRLAKKRRADGAEGDDPKVASPTPVDLAQESPEAQLQREAD
eukprot:738635-Pyramimonas_sp.AAC.1